MPEPEYTPGPWRVSWSREGQSWSILNEDRHMIANAFESEANARRMAAALEMLAALDKVYAYMAGELRPPEWGEIMQQTHDAIAKAKGAVVQDGM